MNDDAGRNSQNNDRQGDLAEHREGTHGNDRRRDFSSICEIGVCRACISLAKTKMLSSRS